MRPSVLGVAALILTYIDIYVYNNIITCHHYRKNKGVETYWWKILLSIFKSAVFVSSAFIIILRLPD